MANNVIEEASGKVMKNKKHMREEEAGGCHISNAWFYSEIPITVELITAKLRGEAVIRGMLWLVCHSSVN